MNPFPPQAAVRSLPLLAALAFAACVGPADRMPAFRGNPGVPWPATDALNRSLPVAQDASGVKPDHTVGIFYFLTHNRSGIEPVYDIAKILAEDPDVLAKPDSPLWGPPRTEYYWGQPLYGYYNSMDPWVLRRHAALLAAAGVDTVIFDTTNRITYRDVYMKVLEIWNEVRREGGRTPQVCFMVNTRAGETAAELYHDLYQPGLYSDLWFRWQGKPLLICDPAEATPEIRKFFTLRKAHWPFTLVNTHNEWHWETAYPQVYSYDRDPNQPEEVNVAVAQNLRATPDAKVTNMSQQDARGRSFHDGHEDTSAGAVNQGYNFAEQWRRAWELAPPFVMVTGWNEWTAGKHSRPGHPVVFVDQFDEEYSRDIEPVSGLHNDNYYYQLVDGIRRYKGVPPLPKASGEKHIDLQAGFAQWRDVQPDFTDPEFDNDHRDFGVGARHYSNTSGRNDLVRMRVARDAMNLYFYVQTREALQGGGDGLLLLLDTDQQHRTGWEGYDFVVNRSRDGRGSWLERNVGGWNWQRVVPVEVRMSGNELMLAVPRAALGLRRGPVAIDFKWWDNPQKPGDIMDVYVSGDAAPDGRFNYRYETQ